jgi:hypothetical protein
MLFIAAPCDDWQCFKKAAANARRLKGTGEILYRQFLQYFRNPMYFSIYILQVASHPIALGGHYVLWRSALQERVDVAERSINAAADKLERLNCNRAAPKHEIMAGLHKACNEVRYFVRGVICLIETHGLSRRRHLRNRFGGHSGDMFPDY